MFALSMDYCGPQGIPYARFLDWDPLSRDAALAWQQRLNATCGGCGQVTADWMTVGDDGKPVELVPAPLMVDVSYCPACAALEGHRANRPKDLTIAHRPTFVPPPPKPVDGSG